MRSILRGFVFLMILNILPFVHAADPVYQDIPAKAMRLRDGLPNTLARLEKGEQVRIAYLGGSITAQNGWRVQSMDWFRKQYPSAKLEEIHAAIGGTGSSLGVFRLDQDVLQYNPELVFVEFAVNDGGTSPQNIWCSMEGIVRKIWKAAPKTEIAFVYTFSVGQEKCILAGNCSRAASAMEMLADFYGIPSVNFCVPVVQLEQEGKLVYKAPKPEEGKIHFSTDGVHPLPAGHEIYTKLLADAFTEMKKMDRPSHMIDYASKLDHSFVKDNWENAKAIPIRESMLSGSWNLLDPQDPQRKSFEKRLGSAIYTSGTPGSSLKFRFKGSKAMIYDLLGPNAGQVWITVDGVKSKHPVARFDSYCTYWRLATLGIADKLDPDKVHSVEITIDSKQPDRKIVAFRLQNPEKELAAPKYQGTNVWFGQIFLIGDLAE
ncbi:MAG: SGNH/GDSL hydrolase family protein [Planctomycetia bacterium]|nr:SGNH/GDSL hydrolase family protein [Planctomycetia bacterium]